MNTFEEMMAEKKKWQDAHRAKLAELGIPFPDLMIEMCGYPTQSDSSLAFEMALIAQKKNNPQ